MDNKKNKQNQENIGMSFDDLSIEDMAKIQGAGDVEGDTTPLTTVTTSSAACGAAIGGAVSIVVSKIIK